MSKKFSAIDLFSGIGGFRIAVERCGGSCIAFSEIDQDAIDAYTQNHKESENSNLGDITKITNLPKHDLLTAGVPCQSWSIAGRNLGFDDDRGQLWNDALYLLNKAQPKAFIFENVKGLADPRNRDSLNYILDRIKAAGYHADYFVLNSSDYNVPQSRVRIFIIGFQKSRFMQAFKLPLKTECRGTLKDIIDEEIIHIIKKEATPSPHNLLGDTTQVKSGSTSLSSNNNGFNDYFLFNDLRNGATTIHTWDIMDTTERQKRICLLLLRNRRKKDFGPLDGNPLSFDHFKSLDDSISETELDELVDVGILKKERYEYAILRKPTIQDDLSDDEKLVLSKSNGETIVTDELSCFREFKVKRIRYGDILGSLVAKGVISCTQYRYDFRFSKISTGLFGINRVFLPSASIFPTLVASDSNDYIAPVSIIAKDENEYKKDFIEQVIEKKQYRKITKVEACRIQGFPDGFILPENRSKWMKLIGNSVSIPLVEKLIQAIVDTGVFSTASEKRTMTQNKAMMPVNRYIDLATIRSQEQLSLF